MNNIEAAKKLVEMYGKYTAYRDDINSQYAEAVAMGAAALVYGREELVYGREELVYGCEEVTQHCQYEQALSR